LLEFGYGCTESVSMNCFASSLACLRLDIAFFLALLCLDKKYWDKNAWRIDATRGIELKTSRASALRL